MSSINLRKINRLQAKEFPVLYSIEWHQINFIYVFVSKIDLLLLGIFFGFFLLMYFFLKK